MKQTNKKYLWLLIPSFIFLALAAFMWGMCIYNYIIVNIKESMDAGEVFGRILIFIYYGVYATIPTVIGAVLLISGLIVRHKINKKETD